MEQKPNLFNYATSELSQDAVLCWILDWINYEEAEMKNFALGFIDRILKLHSYDTLSAMNVKEIEIQRQYKNIDILITIHFNNSDVLYLIIEDKMHTVAHSNQLKKYSETVASQANNQENLIKPIGIYYKTGFVFGHEKKYVEQENYKVFDKVMMIELMDEYKDNIESDIFNDYYEYLKLLKDREDDLVRYIEGDIIDEVKMNDVFNSPEGQWILASRLIEQMNYYIKELYNGTSRGGKPWTQFAINRYFENHNLPDAVFYRIDSRKQGDYIALKQYLDFEDSKNCKGFLGTADTVDILKDKQARLSRLRVCFDNTTAILENEDYYITPGKISNKGKKESEIGVFFINTDIGFSKLLKFLPEFNEVFCDELKKEFGAELFEQN